ncbi:LssY C-terminal domain-containing protein [Acidiphilium sp. JA12-A1]|uniref:LssY C-terminal domain-containing protein n=1 Tax=Acidiphilium sp. JA12-A1 TaxID=1464546 RepID=UPI000461FED5|nr:VTT domain-containing protein [Acidiphilium sp. JA12-A1]KDM68360.1 hypothetical protein ACIDI_6c00030 [Acidiphilium sp. JA12-A1]
MGTGDNHKQRSRRDLLGHLSDTIVHAARTHALLAYGLAFVLTAAEAFPVIGALVPGTAIVVGLGALVPTGALHFWPLVAWSTGGAIVGDGLPFWFGSRFRDRATELWPLNLHPGLLPKGQAFFERHGGAAVIIARFTPGVRAVLPIVAGVSGMMPLRFYVLDVVSAVIWAPAHVAAGVLVGASLAILGVMAGRLEALLVGSIVGLVFLLWLVPRLLRSVINWLETRRRPALAWARAGKGRIRSAVASILDPARTELSGLITLAGALAGSLWLLLGVLQDLIAGDPLVYADHAILHFLEPYRSGIPMEVAVAFSRLGSGAVTLAVVAVTLVWLDRQSAWRGAAYGIAAVIGASLFTAGLDLTLHRAPPSPIAPGWSLMPFPGGDLATSCAVYGILTVIAGRRLGARPRLALMTATALFAGLQLVSRVYLGLDWFSSELAALGFGFAWAAGLGLAYVARPVEPVASWRLVAITAATLAIAGTPAVAFNRNADLAHHEVRRRSSIMTCRDWLQHGWQNLPARSLGMLGSFSGMLTIQWIGPVGGLRHDLAQLGWQPPAPWTFRNALGFLAPRATPAAIPVLPRWDDGRRVDLAMVLAGHGLAADQRLVLRLWKTSVSVITPTGRAQTLRIGEIEMQRLQRMFSTLTVPVSEGSTTAVLPRLAAALPSSRLVTRAADGATVLLAGDRAVDAEECLPPSQKGAER